LQLFGLAVLFGLLLGSAYMQLGTMSAAADAPGVVTVDQSYPYYPYNNYNYGYNNYGYNNYGYNSGYNNYGYNNYGYNSGYNNYGYNSYPYNSGYSYPYSSVNNSYQYNYGYNYGYAPPVSYAQPTVSVVQPVTMTYSSPSVIISSAKLTQPAPLPTSGSYAQPPSGSYTQPASGSYTQSVSVTSGAYGIPISMLTLATSSTLGAHLADGRGMTLYTLSTDTTNTSFCADTCTSVWPPATPTGTPSQQAGVTGTFGAMTRADGNLQATYNGMPLYFFSHDSVAGDTNGQGVTDQWGTWSVARP
jgi:predicted lipoprotein with Yx(FWY)xxD motif